MAVIDDPVAVHESSVEVSLAATEAGVRVPDADRVLELVAVLTIVASLVGLVASLAGIFHAPQVLLGSLLLTGLYGHRTRAQSKWPGLHSKWWHLGLLLLIALFFRVPAYHYVLGGQDEGLYVNIAHHIDYTGGVAVHDNIQRQLQGTPFLGEYLADNRSGPGDYLPGVYARRPANAKVEFQFYHGFQVWMALFCGLFGETAGVYALTFLGVLSILWFYRLALLVTRSYKAGLWAGALLALNPLHAFFSKFPVTEVPALCFSLLGFLMLSAFWSAPADQRRPGMLLLSVLSFLCLFTTRISGFMYVPFFIGIAWVALVTDVYPERRSAIQKWALMALVAYGVSVVYGLVWSHAYSHDIYRLSFQPLLGAHWEAVLATLGALLGAIWLFVAKVTQSSRLRALLSRWITQPLAWGPVVLAISALLAGLFKIYLLGWTAHYLSDPWLGKRWGIAGDRWTAASASSLWTMVVYAGLPMVLAFVLLMFVRRVGPQSVFLKWFVAIFFAYALLLQWVIPYGPYYARYLLSEIVPYSILLVVCVWSALPAGGKIRPLTSLAMVLSLVYCGAVTATQIGKIANDGAYAALSKLVAPIDPGDLILLDSSDGRAVRGDQIKTPLLYTFHLHVATVGKEALDDFPYVSKLDALYDDVYLLSSRSQPPEGYDFVNSVRFRVMMFRPSHGFPRKLVPMHDAVLYLYLRNHPRIPAAVMLPFTPGQLPTEWLQEGWSAPEAWGTWTSGAHAVLAIDRTELPASGGTNQVMVLRVRAFVTTKHPTQRIEVKLDGQPVANLLARYPLADLTMQIPIEPEPAGSARKMRVEFLLPDAISPKVLGMSGDSRQLAIGLTGVEFRSSAATPGRPKHGASP